MKIYVISYNDKTNNIASNIYQDKSWAKVIQIKTTKYFENTMYDSWLINNKHDWLEENYVGTISWQANEKININLIKKRYEQKSDIFTFYNFKQNLIEQACKEHGEIFKHLWIKLLGKMGFSSELALDPNINLFLCNYWCSKPYIMIEYIKFFKRAKDILEKNDEYYCDSKYKGYLSKKDLIEIFGVNYYPIYIFILERLPCFFFYYKKYQITHSIHQL